MIGDTTHLTEDGSDAVAVRRKRLTKSYQAKQEHVRGESKEGWREGGVKPRQSQRSALCLLRGRTNGLGNKQIHFVDGQGRRWDLFGENGYRWRERQSVTRASREAIRGQASEGIPGLGVLRSPPTRSCGGGMPGTGVCLPHHSPAPLLPRSRCILLLTTVWVPSSSSARPQLTRPRHPGLPGRMDQGSCHACSDVHSSTRAIGIELLSPPLYHANPGSAGVFSFLPLDKPLRCAVHT
nr:hypothetical protein CFP56_23928 [Quercus suber]